MTIYGHSGLQIHIDKDIYTNASKLVIKYL